MVTKRNIVQEWSLEKLHLAYLDQWLLFANSFL